ncbi:MAG: penicillin-binding protein 2 [Anaerolineae bacterium]
MLTRPLPPSLRLAILRVLAVAMTVVFVARLGYIQFVQGQGLQARANENRFRLVEVPGQRGVMYDRNGELLMRNRPSFDIVIIPSNLPDDDDAMVKVIEELDALINESQANLPVRQVETGTDTDQATTVSSSSVAINQQGEPQFRERLSVKEAEDKVIGALKGGAYRPIVFAGRVDEKTAFAVAEASYRLPGVELSITPVREYLTGALTAQVLGFMGPIPELYKDDYEAAGYNANEQVGLAGLELTFEKALRGSVGRKNIEVDVNGREVRTVGDISPSAPGNNLVLTIDVKLQQLMQDALQKGLAAAKAEIGVAIAMNPKTGEVLGMVSLPTYDNNLFARGITVDEYSALTSDKRLPLLNHAISALYPPGSVFKIVAASGALQEGIIDENTRLGDSFDGRVDGIIYVDNRFFPDDPRYAQPFYCWIHTYGTGHYRINVQEALAVSCDVFFYQIAGGYRKTFEGLGIDKLIEYTKIFGFGATTGIDLPGENQGLVPSPRWKRLTYAETWSAGDTYNMSIGQGALLATPMQVLNATAAIANGGMLYRPQLVRRIVDTDGKVVEEFKPESIRTLPVDPDMIQTVREGLWSAVNSANGTAKELSVPGVVVAGKTGTAEFYDPEIPLQKGNRLPTHAWFTAFAPYDDPEIALVVFVFNGGEGSTVAMPIAQDILRGYFDLKNARNNPIVPSTVVTATGNLPGLEALITMTVPLTATIGGGN